MGEAVMPDMTLFPSDGGCGQVCQPSHLRYNLILAWKRVMVTISV